MNETIESTPTTVESPADPVSAVTHADPYTYYARLVAERPMYRDEQLGLWVASGASAVTAVLTNTACRVRPSSEPVPAAIRNSPAGAIFGRLVRMNEGPIHGPLKKAVVASLDSVDVRQLRHVTEQWATELSRGIAGSVHGPRLMQFTYELSCYVLGSLMGVPDEDLHGLSHSVRNYLKCLSPACPPDLLERGNASSGELLKQFLALRSDDDAARSATLFDELVGRCRSNGFSDLELIAANAIGFLTQAYEAVAGLISATLLTLARRPDVREQVTQTPDLLSAVVSEVLRFDSPVQNTRRFVAEPTTIGGHDFVPGDTILVVLAAANRDPLANPAPDQFDMTRRDTQLFSFGVGPHACPGQQIATTIASVAVARLLAVGVALDQIDTRPSYLASANVRIPILSRRIGPVHPAS